MKNNNHKNNVNSSAEPASGEPAVNFTERFALTYAEKAVPDMLKAIDSIKRYNRFALLGALATSYLHQAHYLWTQNAGYFAYLVPLIFDAAMVSMLIVVRTAGIAKDAKRWALAVFAGTALLSATVNFLAPGSLGLRFIFALVVVLVIGVELVAGRIRPDFAAIQKQAAELLAAAQTIKPATPETHVESIDDTPATMTAPINEPAVPHIPAPVEPAPIAPVAVTESVHTGDIPARLVSAARMVIVQHRQTSTEPITPDELAGRLNTTPTIAGQLLSTIDNPASTRINGNIPVLGGTR